MKKEMVDFAHSIEVCENSNNKNNETHGFKKNQLNVKYCKI